MILNLDTSPKLSSFQNGQFLRDHVVPIVANNVRDHHFLLYLATLLYHNMVTIVNREGVSGIDSTCMRNQGLLQYLFEFQAMTFRSLSPEIQIFITKYEHLYVARWKL